MATHHGVAPGVPTFSSIESMISQSSLDAVVLCTPPQGREQLALAALAAGLHVMMEKPPATSVSLVLALEHEAAQRNLSLFCAWHSREAGGVESACRWVAAHAPTRVRVTWEEDIRYWHPGQEWILAAGGLGVFDAGINALSVLTAILPQPVVLERARLEIPANRASPIAADLLLRSGRCPIEARFDFLHRGNPRWDIEITSDEATLRLGRGAADYIEEGAAPRHEADREYPRLYARYASLIRSRQRDVDARPLQLVADAFLAGERIIAPAFEF